MNAPKVLEEIAAALRALAENGETRTLYLSQVPLSEDDREHLQNFLGHGGSLIQSHTGNRTIWRATATPGVWLGEYYEGGSRLVLETIEIAGIPELAIPQADDLKRASEDFESRLRRAGAGS